MLKLFENMYIYYCFIIRKISLKGSHVEKYYHA